MRRLAQLIAVVCLLAQAALGSVHAPCLCELAASQEMSCIPLEHDCCVADQRDEPVPDGPCCPDDCDLCFDLPLPQQPLQSQPIDSRAQLQSAHELAPVFAALASALEADVIAHGGVGPPERLHCLHADVLRTTHILI